METAQDKYMFMVKQQLARLMAEKSVRFNPEPIFKLVSGATSRFYVNCKPTTLNPNGMYLIGRIFFNMVKDLQIRGIGGLTFGADPIAIATAFISSIVNFSILNPPFNAFSIRKTQKDHGIIKLIEGDLNARDRVVIVDDVATTGGSTIKAVKRARSEGLEVIKAIVLVDRQEGGLENIQKHVDACAVLTKEDLMNQIKE